MSKSKVTLLAAAIALTFSGAAFATSDVVKPGATEEYAHAYEVTGGSAATSDNPRADVAAAIDLTVSAPDILIGRTDANGQVTVEATLSGAVVHTALLAGSFTVQGLITSVSSVAGSNAFQFTLTPPAGAGFTAGDLFSINAGALQLRDATGLQALGGDVKLAVVIKDTTTGTTLSSASSTSIIGSVQGSSTTVKSGSDLTIDVVNGDRKTFAIAGGAISATHGELGEVVIAQADVNPVTAGTQVASASGTGATTNVNAGDFVFNPAADTVKLTLTVPSSSGFTGAGKGFYADVAGCGVSYTADTDTVAFVVDATDATKFTATVPVPATSGGTYNICAINNGADRMAAQTLALTAQIDLAGALTVDPPAKSNEKFSVLKFNGPVVNVNFFNPKTNVLQESYLRITNTSGAGGQVQIDGTCDNGIASTTPVSFNLDAGHSVLLTSNDIESGNSAKGLSNGLGSCSGGKYRLVVTGRIANMEVQNFLRNRQSAGDVNTNVNNDDNN